MQEESIVAYLSIAGLEDMITNFLPRLNPWLRYGRTWSMLREGREMCSWTDYILVTYHRLIQDVAVQDARHNTYRYLILCCLREAAPAAHSKYLRKQKLLPLKPPKTPGGVDRLFAELRGGNPQATLAGPPPTGVDLTRYLADH